MSDAFVDTDVVVSSSLSENGAAHFLFFSDPAITNFWISDYSQEEILEVGERLKISLPKIKFLLAKLSKIKVSPKIFKEFADYVTDGEDAHIVSGAKSAKAKFLITYNSKHYKIDKIKQDFGIIVLTPAMFLQWLRSKN